MPEGLVYPFSVDAWYRYHAKMAKAEKIAGSHIDRVI
jgi:hypothetical protein